MPMDESPPEWRYLDALPKYGIAEDGRILGAQGRILKPFPHRQGYRLITTGTRKAKKTWKVHRLVALAWVGPCPGTGYEVCHNDGNPENNHASNLRWDTRSNNMKDAVRHGTRHQPRCDGVYQGQAKFSWVQVQEIRARYATGLVTQVSLALEYNCPFQSIHNIVRYKTYKVAP